MQEDWTRIDEAPAYGVSSHGRICRLRDERILRPVVNHQGILMANLLVEGRHTTRSVARLVARYFVQFAHPSFNAPIHRDGERTNCHAENLLWRPRWHALHYHRQFHDPEFQEGKVKLEVVETGEYYIGWRDPCMQYGLRYQDIVLSYANDTYAFPTKLRFRHLR